MVMACQAAQEGVAVPVDVARRLRQGRHKIVLAQQLTGAAQSLLLTAAMQRPICDAEGQVWVGSSNSVAAKPVTWGALPPGRQ